MKKLLSVLITVTLILSSCIIAFAHNNNNEETFSKLDSALIEKLEQSNDDDIISVWVWFKDVDKEVFENAKANARESSGLTEGQYSYALTEQEKDAFNNNQFKDDKEWVDSFNNALDSYSKRTAVERAEYYKKYREYQNAFRQEMSGIFTERNTETKNKLGIDDSEVDFLSILTPSAILNISKSKILEIKNNNEIQFIYYYEVQDLPEPTNPYYNDQMVNMDIDKTKERFNASGSGINVLMNDTGLIWENNSFYQNIPNRTNIYNIYSDSEGIHEYVPEDNESIETAGHCMVVARALKEVAENIKLYCTVHSRMYDIEWTITHKNIDIFNCSANYGSYTSYVSDYPAVWFDYISSEYNIPLVSSCGNGPNWSPANTWPYAISPSSACNSIAVGSCCYDENSQDFRMRNYRYADNTDTGIIHYKPDVVLECPSTSEGAPLLSGTIALILEKFPNLTNNPDSFPLIVKAIVMASCHKKALPATGTNDLQENMFDGLTLKQGAGVFNSYTAMCIAAMQNYKESEISQGNSIIDTITPYSNSCINASLVWFRNNTVPNTYNYDIYDVNIMPLNELTLSVYDGNTQVAYSNKDKAYKQLAYFSAYNNSYYDIKIEKTTVSSDSVKFVYAWSSDATKYINNVEIDGSKIAVGQPLSAKTFYLENGAEVSTDELQYQWQRSTDCSSWNNITSANSSTYVLSGNDQSNYIRCVVSPKSTSLSSYIKYFGSVDDIVVRYGDVNNDTVVDILDVTKIQKHLSGLVSLTNDQKRAGDVNGDGFITNNDAYLITQYCMGNITSFDVENP